MIHQKYKVKENGNLYRDGYSKGIVNTNVNELKEYREKKRLTNTLLSNEQKIQKLENDISDIKNMLVQLLRDRV